MKKTEDDLRRVLAEWSAEKGISPALVPSEHWKIPHGFTSGSSVPDYDSPGCYVFYTADGALWYVGKSQRLGDRPGGKYFRRDGSVIGLHDASYASLQTIKTATVAMAEDLEREIKLRLDLPGNKSTPPGSRK